MRRYPKILFPFFASLLSALACDYLAGQPTAVDTALTTGLWLALALHFLHWLAGIACWGALIARRIDERENSLGLSLALGSSLYALIAFCLAVTGLLRPELRFGLFLFQACGIALAPRTRISIKPVFLVACLPLSFLFLLNLTDALVISPYWDPLHHHLASVRFFWERGRMYFPTNAISAYQEGGFELLFLWPHFFFAEAGGKGLLPVQIFSQLSHLCLGYGAAIAIAYGFARRWLPNPAWRILAITLFTAPLSLQFSIPTAKNDWGIIAWVLAGFWILSTGAAYTGAHNAMKRNRVLVAGFLWGFAWLAKLSSGFALLGLGSLFLLEKAQLKHLRWLVPAFVAGALPFALRNFLSTGDPLFPLFPDFFTLPANAIGPTWREALARYQADPLGWSRLWEWKQEFPLPFLALLCPLLLFFRKEEAGLRSAALAVAIGFTLFATITGSAAELRLIGALLPLSALLLVVLLQRAAAKLPQQWKLDKILPGALLILAALLLPYRWEAVKRAAAIPHAHLLTRGYISGEAQGWVRDNLRPGMRAALLADSRIYHSIPFPIVYLWDAPLLDARLRTSGGARAFLQILKEEGFTHLILSQEKLDLFYPKELVAEVEAYVLGNPQSFVFQSKFSVVADLSTLALL